MTESTRQNRPASARLTAQAADSSWPTTGRGLGTAIARQRDPQALASPRRRELLHRQPWLAWPPAPYVLPDGRVL
jgi:hypothetical protein